MRFEGTDSYSPRRTLSSPSTRRWRSAALADQGRARHRQDAARPRGLARSLGRPLFQWQSSPPPRRQQGLYEYDAVSRLRDSQLGEAKVPRHRQLIKAGRAVEAFEEPFTGDRPDRRDRQGRHRVSERPAAMSRPDGSSTSTRRTARSPRGTGRWSSSRRTNGEGAARAFCAAASSTTSGFPTGRRWRESSTFPLPGIKKAATPGALGGVLQPA